MSMEDLVARNVRRMRIERELSIGELARQAGISKQTVSKLEQGAANPTVATLEAIATALGVGFRTLVTEWGRTTRLGRADEAQWSPVPGGEHRHLAQVFGTGYIRTGVLRLRSDDAAGVRTRETPGALHQLFVLEGEIDAGVPGETVRIGTGDALLFPADSEHVIRAVSREAVAHLTTTAPQRQQLDSGE